MVTRNGDSAHVPLEAEDLVFSVEGRRLLDRVSLGAGKGKFIGLIGPNGAGKTTLLRVLSRLLVVENGSVRLEGRDMEAVSSKDAAKALALVPQAAPNTFGFTSLEIVMMGRYPHLDRFQVEGKHDQDIALEAMRLTETGQFADRVVTSLSGGERQRVFVARAVAQQPRVLLMDEPVSSLDVQHQVKVLDAVRTLVSNGITAIAAMHDLSLAARYCDLLVLMCQGQIVAEGSPEAVLTPANLREVFGVRAVMFRDPFTERLSISLVDDPSHRDDTGMTARVHLLCGGGSGVRLMNELHQAGHLVTAGVLGSGDTDRMVAETLGIPFIAIPAFSPIDDEAHMRHVELVSRADIAVLCDVPIGANNLRNLEALSAARTIVSVESAPFPQRDFTGGVATRLLETLRLRGRARNSEEAIALIYGALCEDGQARAIACGTAQGKGPL